MKNNRTNWSSPKTNIFAAINDLRKALASGYNASLVKEYNENCSHPIRVKKKQDFRQYKFMNGRLTTRQEIMNDKNMSEYDKHLSLNYMNQYALNKEAIEMYYGNGVLSLDNVSSMGRAHLVKVSDFIEFMREIGRDDIADTYHKKYVCPSGLNQKHFFDFFTTDYHNVWGIKKFKHKLWVVVLNDKKTKTNIPTHQKVLIKIFNAVLHPLKYIPRKSVLKMPDYTNYTFRIGAVSSGFSVEFHIPKKFSFK